MTEEQRHELIRLLQKSEDLSSEWARILFPPEKREYELVYHGKEREEDIIANTLAVPLQKVRTFGKNGDGWHNKLIFGDNLQVMKSLLELKREGVLCNADGTQGVRLVYIDPPFATKRDFQGSREQKAYQDKLAGADFIEFLRKRLVLMRELLSDDGCVLVHMDPRKIHYIKVVLDEIMGEPNFRNQVIWRNTNSHNNPNRLGQVHQVVLVYSKGPRYVFNEYMRPHFHAYVEENYRHKDKRGRYRHSDLTGPGIRRGDSGKPWKAYDPTRAGRHWQPASSIYDQLAEDISHLSMLKRLDYFYDHGFIYLPDKDGGQPQGKRYLRKEDGNPVQDLWAYQPFTKGVYETTDECVDEDVQWPSGGAEFVGYPTQKSEGLLNRIVKIYTNDGDLVLDAFAGSGTTNAVAEKVGRRWIAIDCGKLAVYTIQKRMLNLRAEVGNKGPALKPKAFSLYNAGLYDFSKLKELPWDAWRFFALQLFQCRDETHKIGGIQLDGYLKGANVLVFNHQKQPGVRIDEETVQSMHEALGSKVGSRMFIIAPALVFDFQQDYLTLDSVRYYALRIPYSIIHELHQREFAALKQPADEMAVNDTVDAVGFDFIRSPEMDYAVTANKRKGELLNEGVIRIKTFKSEAVVQDSTKKANRETLSMVMLDYDFDTESDVFELDAVFYAETIQKEDWEVRFPLESVGKQLMAVFVDIYGNEARELIPAERFGAQPKARVGNGVKPNPKKGAK
jgi:site-specific DNA-methyltransferase (adenine-specific)/adenine-specific DNA-methyltransferase